MSTQFSVGPSRRVQAGDTPDLNDGLLSRSLSNGLNLVRGSPCVLQDGLILNATTVLLDTGAVPFVPIESVDNTGGEAGDLQASGVEAPQRVALKLKTGITVKPGDYVKPSDDAETVTLWASTDNNDLIYAKYLGKEAAIFNRDAASPFEETLSVGIVPDQNLAAVAGGNNVGWFQLIEGKGGT